MWRGKRSTSNTYFESVILAGGESKRFGSDKCVHEVDGEAMIYRVSKCLGDPLVVTRSPLRGLRTLVESSLSPRNPINAIRAALPYLRAERVFLTGCDFPFLRRGFVELVCSKSYQVSVPVLDYPYGSLDNATVQPLLGCYRVDYLVETIPRVTRLRDLVTEAREVYLVGTEEARTADPSLSSLINVNSWEDMKYRRLRSWTKSYLILR
jgi:molybdopterin-guanine dinucleotide biosynthesis protein A